MEAEIRSLDIKALPYTARFGLGSTEPIKKWARFEMGKSGDLYWTSAIHLRRDVDSSGIHISVHRSGEIRQSWYKGKGKERKKDYSDIGGNIGKSFANISEPREIIHSAENLEPSYLYYGLPTLEDKQKRKNDQSNFIPCLDNRLINSKLHSSLDLVPWIKTADIINYLEKKRNGIFNIDDPRCHVYIFCWKRVSILVTMRFIDGDGPIDIEEVAKTDKNAHPLKRLPHHEELILSESTSLNITEKEKP